MRTCWRRLTARIKSLKLSVSSRVSAKVPSRGNKPGNGCCRSIKRRENMPKACSMQSSEADAGSAPARTSTVCAFSLIQIPWEVLENRTFLPASQNFKWCFCQRQQRSHKMLYGVGGKSRSRLARMTVLSQRRLGQ